MSISMQGNWTVSVKAKNAAFNQRFVVSGAASGNGTHPGVVGSPPVLVIGATWALTVQNNPGNGWVDSADQIKFPTTTATTYRFDIESNDAGNDLDFDDLILTCSAPRTPTDFIVYGHASWYGPECWLNPCSKRYAVIDSVAGLEAASQYPALKHAIDALYPNRRKAVRPHIGPLPDPPPFVPMVLSLEGPGLPAKRAQVLTVRDLPSEPTPKAKNRGGETADVADTVSIVTSTRQIVTSSAASQVAKYDTVAVSSIVDVIRSLCTTGPLSREILQFQEYDRTLAELAGGPYTGTGGRDTLGRCATDRNGNYIFRFTRDPDDFVEEALEDVAIGENAFVQRMPDLIAEVVDSAAPTGISYETAPYWNVGLLRRIDICVPQGRSGSKCQGGLPIQAIGNITIGGLDALHPGARVGFGNVLNADGLVTATGSNGPHTSCAAWAGSLHLYACFDQPASHYTIRWQHPGDSGWQVFQESYLYDNTVTLDEQPVGPFDVSLHVDNAPAATTKAYLNIEDQPTLWKAAHITRKAVISSWVYAPTSGPVTFRIDGYNAAGFPVAHDQVTLYIDNSSPEYDISEVDMAAQTGGDCALFEVTGTNPATPLTVTFRAHHDFMGHFGLTVRKGNGILSLPITATGAPISGDYVAGSAHACNGFHGTGSTPAYVQSDVAPGSGHWLEPGQPFCTFAVNLECTTRVTDGYGAGNSYPAVGRAQYLLGIQQS